MSHGFKKGDHVIAKVRGEITFSQPHNDRADVWLYGGPRIAVDISALEHLPKPLEVNDSVRWNTPDGNTNAFTWTIRAIDGDVALLHGPHIKGIGVCAYQVANRRDLRHA